MMWGFAGSWVGEYTGGDSSYPARLAWMHGRGLATTHVALQQVAEMDDAERDALVQMLVDNDQCLVPTVHFDFLSQDRDEVMRNTDRAIQLVGEYRDLVRAPIVTTVVGRYHRFMREPSLQEQMERLPSALAPIAQACWEFGTPFGIENHGDYYCEDLVELCNRTPFLNIFLDTGNTYLIGEQSLPAIRVAAPYTIGTHFKDHHVWPEKGTYPLRFEVGGAVLGEGDVGLAEAYDIIINNAPEPSKLVMMLEVVAPRPMDPHECMDKSQAFIRSLPEVS